MYCCLVELDEQAHGRRTDVLALTTTTSRRIVAMASSIISRRKPKDYRPALWALTRMYAREAAKDAIRARGARVSRYLPERPR